MYRKIFALGFFDGVHLGHQALLSACKALAAERGCATAAITFEAHPLSAFTNEYPPLLSTLSDRVALLGQFGMEQIVNFPVSGQIMATPWQDFLQALLEEGAAGFVCGDDFRFGSKGAGDVHRLREFCEEKGLPCIVVPEQTLDGVRISSSHIRTLLEAGDLAQAERFLGHPFVFTGQVVHGRALGRTIGIPTANLAVPEKQLLPKRGVYACRACVGESCYAAVTNIGSRPTVGGHHVTVESWLLDFDGDLYGKDVTLEFCEFLRPERKFDSLETLKAEIRHNAQQTREILKSI